MQKQPIYSPGEDSFLALNTLKKVISSFDRLPSLLDMGTGSGFLLLNVLPSISWGVGLDINKDAIKFLKGRYEHINNIAFFHSDLFSFLEKNKVFFEKEVKVKRLRDFKNRSKFDIIVFNAPYLPYDPNLRYGNEPDLVGGKKGYETLLKFLTRASDFLTNDGKLIIVFSSLTKKSVIDDFIKQRTLFEIKTIETKKTLFEEIFCYVLEKAGVLREINDRGFYALEYFSKGKRFKVFRARYNNRFVALKIPMRDSFVKNMYNEFDVLMFLYKYFPKRLPEPLFKGEKFIALEFIEGLPWDKIKEKKGRRWLIKFFKDLLSFAFFLDTLSLNKEEFHRIGKHIIFFDKTPLSYKIIDFERTSKIKKPKNVTQLFSYILNNFSELINNNDDAILFLKEYKNKICKENFEKLISLFD